MSEAQPAPAHIQHLLDMLEAKRKRSIQFRRVIILAVLVMISIFAITIWSRINNFDADTFMVALERDAAAKVWPATSRELDSLSRTVGPAIHRAMAAELDELLPRLGARIATESDLFQENVHKMMLASLDKHFLQEMKEKGPTMKELFSEFSAEGTAYDDLIRRLQASSRGWAQDQLDTIFQEHLLILQSINESTQKLMSEAKADVQEGKTQTAEDVLSLFVEIFNTRLNEGK